jgi:hypothetical protein
VPALFFHGADMMEDTKDGLVFLMSGHADRISNDHKRFLTALTNGEHQAMIPKNTSQLVG